jgi:perosamine synthetase
MIEQHLAHRQALHGIYAWHLSNQPKVRLQTRPPGSAPWVFPVRVKNRDRVAKALAERGIETRPVFTPLHLQAPWRDQRELRAFPVAEAIAREGLLLPTHARMTDRDVNQICDALLEVV